MTFRDPAHDRYVLHTSAIMFEKSRLNCGGMYRKLMNWPGSQSAQLAVTVLNRSCLSFGMISSGVPLRHSRDERKRVTKQGAKSA